MPIMRELNVPPAPHTGMKLHQNSAPVFNRSKWERRRLECHIGQAPQPIKMQQVDHMASHAELSRGQSGSMSEEMNGAKSSACVLTQEGHRCTGALASAVWYLLGAAAFSLGGSGSEPPDCARLLLEPLLLQLPAPALTCPTTAAR